MNVKLPENLSGKSITISEGQKLTKDKNVAWKWIFTISDNGGDFDNCIISYDKVFVKAAFELNLIPPDAYLDMSKDSVKNYLINNGKEELWTKLQGYVYGVKIKEAVPYKDVISVIVKLLNTGHKILIISHKTKYPIIGVNYNLHEAALEWIGNNLRHEKKPIFDRGKIYFNATIDEKINCISENKCNVFFDDLEKILKHPKFPKFTKKYHFSPNAPMNRIEHDITVTNSWNNFLKNIENDEIN